MEKQTASPAPRLFAVHPFVRANRFKLGMFHCGLLALLVFFYAGFGESFSSLITGTLRECWHGAAAAPCFSSAPDFFTVAAMIGALFIGFLLSIFSGGWLFWSGWGLILMTLVGIGVGGGSTAEGGLTGWPFILASFAMGSLYSFRVRNQYELLATARIRASFGNQLPEAHIQKLLRYPFQFSRMPTSRLVTLIHIGYADFANTAETLSPQEAFHELQRITHYITAIVHKFGGSIGRRDGNSTLAFFGYTFDGKESSDFKVDEALDCAIEILRQSLKESLEASSRGKIYCPLRVTMNTTAAYFGDIGDEDSWNLILMGPGVTLTQQLEESCDEFRLLMSATTRDMIRRFDPTTVTISRRFLQIKYHKELIEAYDVDPFLKDAEEISKVLSQYREMVSIQRKEPRWPVPSDTPITATSDFGGGSLINFSLSGLAVKMGVYLARGVEIAVQLESENGKLQDALAKVGLQSIPAEVRWAKLAGESFVHGLRLKNLTADQRVALMNALREVVRGEGNK